MILLNEARRRVINYAKRYNEKLLNKDFLIIYRDIEDYKIKYIEITFKKEHYQHLTGLELIDKNGNRIEHHSVDFYRKCIEQKLSLKEIRFRRDGTSPLKLTALPSLSDFSKIVRITGDYNNSKRYLAVDKLVGGVNFCLGVKFDGKKYVPASALCENIKKLAVKTSQVLVIYSKSNDSLYYEEVKHIAKGLNLEKLKLPENIQDMIKR